MGFAFGVDMKDSYVSELKDDIKEYENFEKHGMERIKKYYTLPESDREDKTGLYKPPHQFLIEKAEESIYFGINSLKNEERLISRFDISYLLFGVGTELLLKAIILKEDPKYFLEKCKGPKTPPFKSCQEWLINFLKNRTREPVCNRINDVLDLIRIKRNNLVHLQFHDMVFHGEYRQMYAVLRFLFSYFFKEEEVIINILEKEEKELKKYIVGIDYEKVDLDVLSNK